MDTNKVLKCLIFVCIWASFAAPGAPSSPCNLLLAKVIPRTYMPDYAIELPSSGALLAKNLRVPQLPIGNYVYLITNRGEILLAAKYNLKKMPQGLATHKSLLKMYEKRRGTSAEPRIVAAGEFQTAFGRVAEISNKSGNFRGSKPSLDLAVQVLRSRGLPMDSSTQIKQVDPKKEEDRGHTPKDRELDGFRLQVLSEVAGLQQSQKIKELFTRFYWLIRESFPDLSGRKALLAMMEVREKGVRKIGKYDGYATFNYPLSTAYTVDGFEFGIWSIEISGQYEPQSGDRFKRGVPTQINNFLIGAGDTLPPDLRTRWLILAENFAGLD